MRVFLDTNVLASAFATRGLCEDVLREILISHELIVATPLLQELERVLVEKFKVPIPIVNNVITFLKQDSIEAKPKQNIKISIQDKDDVLILSCALHENTDIFVTGDHELLKLKGIGKMRIISPRGFWDFLKKS